MFAQAFNHRRVRVVLTACLLLISTVAILRLKPGRRFFVGERQNHGNLDHVHTGPFPEDQTRVEESSSNASATAAALLPAHSSLSSSETTIWKSMDGCAYVFYATTDDYACSVLVNMRRLKDLNTTLPIHVLVSRAISTVILGALEEAGAVIHIEDPPPLAPGSIDWYRDCLLKLVAFKMHIISPNLKRVLVLDADQLILQNLDHIFLLPEEDLIAPRAYWIASDFLSSTFMLISLSDRLWNVVEEALRVIQGDKYDMDLVNDLCRDTATVLGGEYIVPNSHWEDWNLPKWYHASLNPHETDQNTDEMKTDTLNSSDTSVSQANLSTELYGLYEASKVLHYFAAGKPWQFGIGSVESMRPDAHPLFSEQFDTWQRIALEVCPR